MGVEDDSLEQSGGADSRHDLHALKAVAAVAYELARDEATVECAAEATFKRSAEATPRPREGEGPEEVAVAGGEVLVAVEFHPDGAGDVEGGPSFKDLTPNVKDPLVIDPDLSRVEDRRRAELYLDGRLRGRRLNARCR